ncbi:ADP-ribosylglycohydrolase family protein [Streptomyces sp. NPDC056160]|uniref:ADP-ribosylglycohydrolase family protein n=1 Tax=Streptomyces sp. NPDC056160 TaxID=3345731 RepID=UPI0035E1C848
MSELWKPSGEATAVYRARVRGCLLGGAVGDALGYPIEFSALDRIRATHGPRGLTGLVTAAADAGEVGLISDDTQMTLFTAEGIRQAQQQGHGPRLGSGGFRLVRWAYERWLETQSRTGPHASELARPTGGSYAGPRGGLVTEAWLYSRRAPGNACMSGLALDLVPDPAAVLGAPGPINSDSKGCGAVMRSAPFGLTGAGPESAFDSAARCAQMTHGHPTGYYAAGAFAAIIACVVAGDSVEGAVLRSLRLLGRHAGHEETTAALTRALDLAAEGSPSAEQVERLGAGWVAEEALAIGVYAALAASGVENALLLAVNHSGDSDSTGSICGNILGARYGDHALPHAWVERVEGRARIAALADDLAAGSVPA